MMITTTTKMNARGTTIDAIIKTESDFSFSSSDDSVGALACTSGLVVVIIVAVIVVVLVIELVENDEEVDVVIVLV